MMNGIYNAEDLALLGSKRGWVPIWLWTHVLFRFELYEYTPISWLTYKRAKVKK